MIIKKEEAEKGEGEEKGGEVGHFWAGHEIVRWHSGNVDRQHGMFLPRVLAFASCIYSTFFFRCGIASVGMLWAGPISGALYIRNLALLKRMYQIGEKFR